MSHHAQKRVLLERLRALGLRLDGIEEALESPHSKDWEDQAIEREGEEVLERLGESGQAEIARIQSALKRMARGEYGICTRCGQEISAKRLETVPEAPLCKDCAAEV
ncbi:TraR/DksA family transcriptional regulator [Mameliella sediminis]|uniref:TraR/DksA family transcriptional regulator n=1 Tax=Mameliella sediminis TaxID=2836866 RepID=UPI001C45C1DD|nr:TraR/DksA family transcriptional regulator [Mameliella sediminis]MBV7396598.1 TraR/DksA family transcriptional regulator [Mameliella sediminis]MBY6162887.1 TraR/DksA family transcriptional regulator [Mameliella alba]MBY6171151.1 TraR/DksA family transcriptional regulator [Mameliella alba]MBY6176375.1 TraR/DksA family transcriptional regulator [Mameliella alba]